MPLLLPVAPPYVFQQPTWPVFDRVGPGFTTASSVNTGSCTHTSTYRANAGLVFISQGVTLTSYTVTWGGVSCSVLGSIQGNTSAVYGLLNPPTGAQTIVVNSGASSDLTIDTLTYYGVTAFANANGSSTSFASSISFTMTSATNHVPVVGFSSNSCFFTAMNQHVQSNRTVNPTQCVMDAVGAATVVFSATMSSTTGAGWVGVDLV